MSVAVMAISTLRTTTAAALHFRRTNYNAVILPPRSGKQPALYDTPLDHCDDNIAALEAPAGREPRWVLPGGKMNFFAPRPAAPLS